MKILFIFIIFYFLTITINFSFCNNNNNNNKPNKHSQIKHLNSWAKPYIFDTYSVRKLVEEQGKELFEGINKDEQYYAVYTDEKSIKKGKEILKVKWTTVLNIDTLSVEQPDLFEKLIEMQLAEEDILVVGLMVYRYCLDEENYDLKAWVRSLPEHYNSALYFNDEELSLLKGSPAFVQIMLEKESAKELFDKLSSTVFKDELIKDNCKVPLNDWDRFRWSYSTISSRRIYVPNPESSKPSVVLVPVLDFFRRSNTPNADVQYDEELGTVDVRSIEDIKPYNEIFVNFDRHYCNSELLSDNGYIFKEIDQHSCVNVLLEELLETINENDPKKQEKLLLINRFFKEEAKMLRISLDSLTEDLLKVSKFVAYRQESVVEYLIKLVELKQSHYITTLEQDKQFIKTPEYTQLTTKSKLAFDLSFQEKQILSVVKSNLKSNIESSANTNTNSNDNTKGESKKVKDEL